MPRDNSTKLDIFKQQKYVSRVLKFFDSKYSRKKKYGLTLGSLAIARYVCSTIESNFHRRKSASNKLSISQIARQCLCDRKTARNHVENLISNRILKKDKKDIYSYGQVLLAWGIFSFRLDVGKISPLVRSGEKLPTSKSSTYSTREASQKNEKRHAPVDSQSTSHKPEIDFVKASEDVVANSWKKVLPNNRPSRYKDLPYEP